MALWLKVIIYNKTISDKQTENEKLTYIFLKLIFLEELKSGD